MSKVFRLFSILFVSTILAGIALLIPQNAHAACTAKPGVAVVGYQGGVRSVTYTVRVTNNCGGSRNFRLLVSQLPTSPRNLVADWEIPAGSGNWNQAFFTSSPIGSGRSRDFTVRVRRNIDVFHPDGTYYNVVFKANVREGGQVIGTFGTRATHYVVQNRPDFTFRSFSFPGGLTCRNTKPTVIIRNLGWVGTDRNIVVQVKNRAGGQTINHTVTQYISKREIIDLTNRFSGMNRPAPGTYDAIAVVDLNNNVTEEDEGNNRATSRYSTSPCNPRGAHDSSSCEVSTGWACDPDNFDRALTIHFYEGSTYLGATTANKSRPDVKNAGKCGTNANVGFTWATPAGLKDGNAHTIKAFALNVGPTGGNVELPFNRSFQCTIQQERHAECRNEACVQVDGPGADACSTNADCITQTETHTECSATNQCVPVPGAGNNECSVDSDCTTTGPHFISGGLFVDKNKNQIQDRSADPDLNEPFIEGSFGLGGDSSDSTTAPEFEFDNLPAGQYAITYFKRAGEIMTIPGSVGNPVIGNITIGQGDCINNTYYDCDANGNAINVLFGIEEPVDPTISRIWLRGIGGDMRLDEEDYKNDMPANKYFSEFPVQPKHGIVFGWDLDLGQGTSNNSGWYIENEPHAFPTIKTEYNKVLTQLKNKGALNSSIDASMVSACSNLDITSCNLGTNAGVALYRSTDDVIIENDYIFNGNKKHIFLIDGDLTINGNITVANGSFVMFVVSGNIEVGSDVTRIDGIFSANENFTVSFGTSPLTINGSVIVNANEKSNTFVNEREGGDNDNPSVDIVYRPDFVLNASPLISTSSYSISEVAPGAQINP